MVKWNATLEEREVLEAIYKRATKKNPGINKTNFTMDMEATHCNGCRLDLDKLLNFPDFDFWHDLHGIANHIDRHTGELKDCFLPRCAV